MSDVNTNKFGGALLFILGEFAAAEEEMIEDGGMEVFGEDDQGREGSCEVSINELAKAASDEIIHLSDQLAKANERFEKLIQEKEGYRLRLEKQKEVVERYQQEAIETAKAQERFCIGRVVDAFEKAQIPRHAKAGCIGEFNFIIEDGVCCPQCWEEQSADCDMCNGESGESGLSDLTATVPWGLCKDIWLRMNKIYAEQLRKEQEQ
ncbi:hypothetical protein E5672_07580 [Alteromonas portus]|uniref:Uncharacterized protein n=1 Tax=Alteromonas portus TaxID=2565549 RepID=A0A4U0ZNZ8_9ALTE|nr:hypothetical protein [Alteromonas portus]TKB03940.1 hypothetical protein E5672_07580 [Alteromonas portus]